MTLYASTPPVCLRPRLYCASPYTRAKMWRPLHDATILGPDVEIVSTWHNNPVLEKGVSPSEFAIHWTRDFEEIRSADALLAYAERLDRPNGTLVEIGYATARHIPVYVVGNYPWGSWKFHPRITHHNTLREAVIDILRSTTPLEMRSTHNDSA
jgi:hypothetical protein